MLKKCILASLCLSLIAFATAQASPLVPFDTHINVSADGMAEIQLAVPTSPPFADYSLQGTANEFTSGGISVGSDVTLGNTPGCLHHGSVASAAGVQFEQIAFNAYALTLSANANGDLFRDPAPNFDQSHFESHATAYVQSSFEILPLPGQQPGDLVTVHLDLTHFGILSRTNRAGAHSLASLQVSTANDYYQYGSTLNTPPFPMNPGFQEEQFFGVRDIHENYTIETEVGSVIDITAELFCDAGGTLFAPDFFDYVDANSDFQNGLQLHMTVMPEPATVSLFLLGAIGICRRRKNKI